MIASNHTEDPSALVLSYDRQSPPAITRYWHPEEALMREVLWMLDGSGSVGAIFDLGSGASTFLQRTNLIPKTEGSLKVALGEIGNTFALTKEQLADCLLVTRKTIYNWLDGTSSPQQTNFSRLYEFKLLCKDWRYKNLAVDKLQLTEPVIDNKSLLDLLKEEKLDLERILFAGSRLGIDHIAKPLLDPFV